MPEREQRMRFRSCRQPTFASSQRSRTRQIKQNIISYAIALSFGVRLVYGSTSKSFFHVRSSNCGVVAGPLVWPKC